MKISIGKKILAGIVSTALLCSAAPSAFAASLSTSVDGTLVSDTATGTVIYETSFEDQDVSEFTGRGGVETITATSDDAYTGDYSMLVSDRTKTWHGPQFLMSDRCEAGTEYYVSAWVKTPWYATVTLSWEYTDSEGTRHYSNLASATSQGGWVEIPATKFSFTEDQATNVYIYFECGDTCTISIDDFSVTEVPETPIEEDLVSLSDVYANDFKIGTAITTSNLASKSFMALVEKHFSGSITAGNEMKPDSVLNQTASVAYYEETGDDTNPQVSFEAAKSVINYCIENDIPMRAHTLVWHSQTPDWFFKEGFSDDGDWVSEDKMLQRMENYIKNYFETLATDYPDLEIYACDVVNEAWTDSGTPRTAGSNNTTTGQSAWVQVFGDNSFIEPAFEYARKYAPEGCKLYYNDYNEYISAKTNAIVEMATELQEKGLIDGIGMQSHLDVSFPTASAYKTALAKFAATGLDIQITELDVTTSSNSDSDLETQATYYNDIMDAIEEYKDSVSAVIFWGVTDDQSWRSSKYPLLFDSDYAAKPAYYAIIEGKEVETTTTTTTVAETTTTTTVTTTTTAEVTTTTEEITTTEPSTLPDGVTYGDANLDGEVNISDAVLIMSYVGNSVTYPISENGLLAADVYSRGDGVSNTDALAVQKLISGALDELPESWQNEA